MDRSLSQDHIAFGPDTPSASDTFPEDAHLVDPEPEHRDTDVRKKVRPDIRRSRSTSVIHSSRRGSTQHAQGHQLPDLPSQQHAYRSQEPTSVRSSSQASPRPYETPVFLPRETYIDASEPYFGKRPMTPPDSTSESTTPDKSPIGAPIRSFPGTMAARSARAKKSAQQRTVEGVKPQKAVREHHWKTVFKGIFTRSPVDKAQFERIEDRHWADE